jgi:cell wall-associated NlpC family hydrolase
VIYSSSHRVVVSQRRATSSPRLVVPQRTTTSSVALPRTVTGLSKSARAVAVALAQVGKPYRYGALGPSSFDCSGLAKFAWGAAGVGMSHSAAAQYAGFTKVTRAQLQPGDLVFFGRPIYHVGIYLGGGMMVHAPAPGQRVQITSINILPLVGASRPAI